MNKTLKFFLTFLFLFLMNLLLFKVLASLDFKLTMSEKSYIVPPLFSIIVLYMIDKRIRNKKKWIYILGRTFVLPIFYPKSAVGREIGAFGEEVQFLFGDWGKIVVIRWVYTLRKSNSNHVNVALPYICDWLRQSYLQPQNSVLSSLRLVS